MPHLKMFLLQTMMILIVQSQESEYNQLLNQTLSRERVNYDEANMYNNHSSLHNS